MAYGLKYKIGFKNKYSNYYELWIKKLAYSGVSTYIKSGANPCVISMPSAEDDVLEPIRGQELVAELVAETDFQLAEFFTSTDREYIVELHPQGTEYKAKLTITSLDSGSTNDPAVSIPMTNYPTQTGSKPEAEFTVPGVPTSTVKRPTAKLVWVYTYNGAIRQEDITSAVPVYATDTIADIAQNLIAAINNDKFTGSYVSGGTGKIVSANYPLLEPVSMSRTTLVLRITSNDEFIDGYSSLFTLGEPPAAFYLYVGELRNLYAQGLDIYWYDFKYLFYAKSGETINQFCDRVVSEIDNTPAGIYPGNDVWTDDIIGVTPPNWTLRVSHNGSGTLTFTLEGGGEDYNGQGITFSRYPDLLDQSLTPPAGFGFTTTNTTTLGTYNAYQYSQVSGGTSDPISYTIQIDSGSGFTNLVSYTKQAGDTIADIISALVDLINATSYSAIIDPYDPQSLIITAPTGTGNGYAAQWVIVGNSTATNDTFTSVNPDVFLWKGFIIPNLYNEPYRSNPYKVTLRATDGLGDLKNKDFVDVFDEEITGDITLFEAITICLGKTELNLYIDEIFNIYEDNFDNTSADSPLKQAYIDAIMFQNMKCDVVIRKILSQFNARIYQSNGKWIIERIPEKSATYYRRTYDFDGNYKSVTSEYKEVTLSGASGNSKPIADSGTLETEQAYSEVRTKYDYGKKIQLLKNSSFDNFSVIDNTWLTSGFTRYLFPGEPYSYPSVLQELGDAYNSVENPTASRGYIYQTFDLEASTNHKYRITGKYGFFNESPGSVTPTEFSKIMVKLTGTSNTYYADSNGEWQSSETFISLDYENKKWLSFDILIDSLPVDGEVEFRIYLMHLAVAVANVWVGWDYATFEVTGAIAAGEYASKRYVSSYRKFSGIKEVELLAADVPNIASRDTIYSNLLKNSSGKGLLTWDDGFTLSSILRTELHKLFSVHGHRFSTDIRSEEISFETVLKDSNNSDRKFIINSCSWSVKNSMFSGEWIEFAKTQLTEDTEELFLPFDEEKTGSQTYNPVSGGVSTTVVATIPADVLREADIIDNLNSNSYLNPLSANQGKVLKGIFDKFWDNVNEKFKSLVANGSSAIAFVFDTAVAYTTAGAKLLSLKNNGTEKFYVDKYGNAYAALKPIGTYNQVSTASSSTPAPTGNYRENEYYLTALSANATFAAPSGTPANGNTLLIRIEDNGTARTLSWNSIYEAVGVTLPTTTTASKKMYVGCIYNSTDSKWDVVSVIEES